MAEWLYEAGIGENRAALVEQGEIVAIRIERHGHAYRLGGIVQARLGASLPNGGAQLRVADSAEPLLLEHKPKSFTEGAPLLVEVVREAIPERSNSKPARARIAPEGAQAGDGPDLLAQLEASAIPVRHISVRSADLAAQDALEAAGWSEVLHIAQSGVMPFTGGLLRLSITPAMALIDIDGHLPPLALCKAGAIASARMIRLLDLGGAIGLDLPVPPHAGKAERQEAALAFDAALPQPFERTAINGFGFMQIIRPRPRANVSELLAADKNLSMALALLRQAQRSQGHGACTIVAHEAVIAHLEAHAEWIAQLGRELGVVIHLRADNSQIVPSGITGSGYVHTEHV